MDWEVLQMKKDLGIKPYLFPMPVLLIASYGDDGKVDVMNMAWGGICAENMVSLNIAESHKSAANIKKRKAFTISVADAAHLQEADFFGIVSANQELDKFKKSGLTAVKSSKVDAPVIKELPLTLECEAAEIKQESYGFHVLGKIVGTLAEENILDAAGKVDPAKLDALIFDPFQHGYYKVGAKAGVAFQAGAALK
jgi:flavin reductase (DIM6/NTAB) family NADH-FMN oxidoreductase RutF